MKQAKLAVLLSSIILLNACNNNPVHFLFVGPLKTKVAPDNREPASINNEPTVINERSTKKIPIKPIKEPISEPIDKSMTEPIETEAPPIMVPLDAMAFDLNPEPQMGATCLRSVKADCVLKKGSQHFRDDDFKVNDTSTASVFDTQVQKNNVYCKLPCDNDTAENYIYTFDEYLAIY